MIPKLVFLSSIPSPGSDIVQLGPIPLRLYGVMIALGVLAAIWITQRRWVRWGGDPDDIVSVAIWAVPAGLIGARLYHVITDWNDKYSDGRWPEAFKIWQGGLGIPGGILLGTVVGILVARRLVPQWRLMTDAAAPAIPVAQAIGRLGNYFNQELFGRPTDLPWGLRIDLEHRPAGYVEYETFHPTFLYEALWNLGLAGLIIWGSSKWVFKPGRWFALYVVGYGFGRLWVESLRIDEATLIAGLRVNIWMSLIIIACGLVWLLWGGGPLDREATERLRAGESFEAILGAAAQFPERRHQAVGVGAASAIAGEEPTGEATADSDDAEPGDVSAIVVDEPADEDAGDAPSVEESTSGDSEEGPADGIGEGGPDPDGPVAEGTVTEEDAAEPEVGLDPQEGA